MSLRSNDLECMLNSDVSKQQMLPDEVIFNRHLADVQYVCYLGCELI